MKELPEDLQTKIIAYIDGDLPADEAAALEVYLANTDSGLSEMIVGMMADRHSISVLPKISAPQDLSGRVMEELERNSLLHGVEQELTRPHRPWWHSRVAIAAGLALVIGGFTYFVVHSIVRPPGPMDRPPVAVTEKPTEIARARTAETDDRDKEARQVAVLEAQKPGEFDQPRRGGGAGAGGGGGGDPARFSKDSAVAGAPFFEEADASRDELLAASNSHGNQALILDLKAPAEEKILNDRDVIQRGVAAATREGYIAAPDAQQVLAEVHAAPDTAVDGPPVVVYIQARDQDDYARLQDRLAGFMANDEDAKVNLIRTNQVSPTGLTINGGTLNLSGNNTYTGTTVLNNGTMVLNNNAGNSFTGGTTITSGGAIVTNSNSYTGTSTVSAGTLTVNSGSAGAPAAGPAEKKADYAYGMTEKPKAFDVNNNSMDYKSNVGSQYNNTAPNIGPVTQQQQYTNNDFAFNNTNTLNGAFNLTGDNNYDINRLQYKGNVTPRGYTVINPDSYRGRNLRAAEQQDARQKFVDRDAFVGAAGTPYRVFLQPEQLVQVTSEFRVLAIKRGQAPYIIPRDVSGTSDESSVGRDAVAPSIPAPATAPATAAPSREFAPGILQAPPSPAANGKAGAEKGGSSGEVEQHAKNEEFSQKASAGAKGAQQPANQAAAPAGRWIEVIIAMDPPPAAASQPAVAPNAAMDRNSSGR